MFFSCDNKTKNLMQVLPPQPTLLFEKDTIVIFDEEYPVSIGIIDSLLLVINRKDSAVFNLIDIQSKSIEKFGQYGHGPEDFINPDFIINNGTTDKKHNNLLLTDVNNNKIISLDLSDIKNIKYDLISKFPPKFTHHRI